jgi:hypothetical protein
MRGGWTILGCLRKALVVLLALAFIVMLLPMSIWLVTLDQVFLNRDTYTNALGGNGLYTELIPNLLPTLVHGRAGQQRIEGLEVTVEDMFGNLSARDWKAITELLMPPDWLRAQIERNINAVFDWLESDQPLPEIELDMASLRARLVGREGHEVATRLITSWSPCTPQQVRELERFLEGQGEFVFCEPPSQMLARVSATVTEPALVTLASALPESFRLREYVLNPPPEERRDAAAIAGDLHQTKYNVNVYRRLASLLYLGPAAALALIVIVVVRNARAFFTWMGVPLLIGGLVALIWPVWLLLSGLGVTDWLRQPMDKVLRQAGPVAARVVQGVVNSLIGSYAQPMLVQAGMVIVLGFVALVLAFMVLRPAARSGAGAGTLTSMRMNPQERPAGAGAPAE